jgi:hypothetical protein
VIEKKPLDDGAAVEVTFVLPTDWATSDVSVAGDFNEWNPSKTPLVADGDRLVGSAVVAGGRRYAFRYFSDGKWFNDDAADAYEPNEYGGYNCVLDLA